LPIATSAEHEAKAMPHQQKPANSGFAAMQYYWMRFKWAKSAGQSAKSAGSHAGI